MGNQKLIAALQKCVRECLYCADACLDEDNLKKMLPCIRLDRACAETCQAAANLLAMNAGNAGKVVNLCEEICRQCEEECRKHEAQHCQDCAKACKECAEACASMAV